MPSLRTILSALSVISLVVCSATSSSFHTSPTAIVMVKDSPATSFLSVVSSSATVSRGSTLASFVGGTQASEPAIDHTKRDEVEVIVASYDGLVFSWTTTFSAAQATSIASQGSEAPQGVTETPAPAVAPWTSQIADDVSASATSAAASPVKSSTGDCMADSSLLLNWDDEPTWSGDDNSTFPPVLSPYHHLFFSNGYAYAPPPEDPYPPHSPPQLAVFELNADTANVGIASTSGSRAGEIGAGPRAANPYFHFDAHSAWLGCDDAGSVDCMVQMTGFRWDNGTGQEAMQHRQYLWIPACPGYRSCQLEFVALDSGFTDLSGLQIEAFVGGEAVMFFMDDLDMAWTDGSCEAGEARSMVRKK